MNIPTSMSEIVASLSDAVVASGKKLVDIGKEPIHQYLEKVGDIICSGRASSGKAS